MKRTLLTSALAIALGFSSAYAADGDITVTVDYSNGSVAGRTWTSTATPGATVSMNGGDLLENNGYLFFNTAAQTRTVTIASTSDEYYVSAYTMSVISVSTDVVTFTAGTQSVASSPTPQTFAVSGITEEETASFTITPAVAEAKKATVKEFTVTLSAKSTNSVYTPITRNAGWSVTGCSSAANENGSANGTGDISNVIDENPATYWHNDWNACSGVTDRHFFILDLGEESEFDACSFLQRSDDVAWNGAFAEAKIFVSSEAFADISHSTISSYLEANTPSLTATIQPSLRNKVQYLSLIHI